MLEELADIQCPSCFQWFSFTLPAEQSSGGETDEQIELDYDCEVCCRPMLVIVCHGSAYARGLDD